eukprot:scaffold14059_cov47-Phaeocystis_antarctica.AAC.2
MGQVRLARAPEAEAGCPVGRALPWERCAAEGRQARPEEAQALSSGTAKRALGHTAEPASNSSTLRT